MHRDWLFISIGFTGAFTFLYYSRLAIRMFRKPMELVALFSPKGGCQEAIVMAIKQARKEILVQAYSFTADPITFALVDAKKRGVKVEILLDRSNEVETYSDLKILREKGLEPMIDAKHAIAHNKIMVFDQKTIITGSYNFTNQAEGDNAENIVIIRNNAALVKAYRDNFFHHKAHCKQPVDKPAEAHFGGHRSAA